MAPLLNVMVVLRTLDQVPLFLFKPLVVVLVDQKEMKILVQKSQYHTEEVVLADLVVVLLEMLTIKVVVPLILHRIHNK
tara:strand:- start:1280 stop:1516 length:237 start_codon:yes stop_codon:yes gene_type:complete